MALATKPTAIRKLTRLPTGQMSVSFVDAETGEVIPNDQLGAYDIVEQAGQEQSLKGLGLSPTETSPTPTQSEQTTSQAVIKDSTNTDSDHVTTGSPAKKNIKDSVDSTKGDYGYINKPGILGLASGFNPVARAVNIGINAKNVHAVGTAREDAGLEPRGMLEKVKNIMMGQDDYVGDAIIGDKQYSIGLGDLDPSGRTTLTPSEAKQRGLEAGGIQTATKDQTIDAINAFRQDGNPPRADSRQSGIIGGAKNAISDFFNNLFNDNDSETTTSNVEYAGEDYYPEAPTPSSKPYQEGSTTYGGGGRDSGGSTTSNEQDSTTQGSGGASNGGTGLY